MLRALKTSLGSAKEKLRDLFYQHGKLCATHPLVVLSLAFTLMNTCSAPAIWAYFYNPSSIERVWEFSGSAVPVSPESLPPPGSNIIEVEQIIIETSLKEEMKSDRILDPGSLNTSTLKLANRIQLALSRAQARIESKDDYLLDDICLKLTPDDRCLIYSPLEFWSNQVEFLQEDASLPETVSNWVVNSTMGFSIPAWAVFSGIQQDRDPKSFYGASALQLTYFLKPHSGPLNNEAHQIWDILWGEVSKDFVQHVEEIGELSFVSDTETSSYSKPTLLEVSSNI